MIFRKLLHQAFPSWPSCTFPRQLFTFFRLALFFSHALAARGRIFMTPLMAFQPKLSAVLNVTVMVFIPTFDSLPQFLCSFVSSSCSLAAPPSSLFNTSSRQTHLRLIPIHNLSSTFTALSLLPQSLLQSPSASLLNSAMFIILSVSISTYITSPIISVLLSNSPPFLILSIFISTRCASMV